MKEKSPKRYFIAHTVLGLVLKTVAALVLLESGARLFIAYTANLDNYEELRTSANAITPVFTRLVIGVVIYVLGLILDLVIHHGDQNANAAAPPPLRPGPTPPPLIPQSPAPAEKKTSPKITDDPGPVYYLD